MKKLQADAKALKNENVKLDNAKKKMVKDMEVDKLNEDLLKTLRDEIAELEKEVVVLRANVRED